MSNKTAASGVMQNEITVPAFSTGEVQYLDIHPNYFRVTNYGEGTILCGLTKTPTENNYDFSCGAKSMKTFADVFSRRYLYICNPTGSPIRVRIDALYAEFDPLILALANVDLDFSGISLETSTEITGFRSALPEGENHIGHVTVDNECLPVKVTNYSLFRYHEFLEGVATPEGVTYTRSTETRHICEIAFFSNDGTEDIVLNAGRSSDRKITVKPGEVINNLRGCIYFCTMTGNNVPFRLAVVEVDQ